jgi:hypothetical protein
MDPGLAAALGILLSVLGLNAAALCYGGGHRRR